jgi:hypothetical protein
MTQPIVLRQPGPGSHSVPGELSGLPLAALEARLSRLIRRYLSVPSRRLAGRVVSYCEAVCAHPELRDHRALCGYRRLARHWRCLADAGPCAPTEMPARVHHLGPLQA